MEPGGAARDRRDIRGAEVGGERALEGRQPGAEGEPAGAQCVEDKLFLARADGRPRQRNHLAGTRTLAGSMPASSESTSASQLASMMFSDTPIAPQVSWPSVASRRTRVIAPVPLVSSRMRTLKLTSWMSRRCG